MFRSRRREVVFPQSEHAALSAALAAAWSEAFAPVRLPRDGFLRGVALHDRGYEDHDADEIGRMERARWLEIQERGFAPQDDPVVDLVVALHVRRLVSGGTDHGARRLLAAMDDALPALVAAAGARPDDAAAADRITNLCDRIAFDFCLEEAASGGVDVVAADETPIRVTYALDGDGTIELDPWPLAVPTVPGGIVGYRAAGYPTVLDAVPTPFLVRPDAEGGVR
jgi:hypothetical protein